MNLLRLTDAHHTLLIGPTRSGKGRSVIIPTAMTNPETTIYFDFKGELYAETAVFRAREFGHEIIVLDPFREQVVNPDTLNVLSGIDPKSPRSLSQIHAIAEAGIEKDFNARDRHWEKRAVMALKGSIATVVYFFPAELRNLQQVANIMASKELLASAIMTLKNSTLFNGLLARLGDEMSQPTGKELDSILSTAGTSLAFLSDPAIFESTLTSSFDINDLAKKSFYLILPLKYAISHAGVMKTWTTAFVQAVINRGLNGSPVNMILDEVAVMGDFPVLRQIPTIGAGYGLKAMFVYQSLGQLGITFPEDKGQTLRSNSSQIFLPAQDQQTLQDISDVLGKCTYVIENGSITVGETSQSDPHGKGGSSWSRSQTKSTQQIARELARPEEIRSWTNTAIVIHKGVPPIATTLALYDKHDLSSRRMGTLRMIFDTFFLFVLAAAIAAVWTYGLFHNWYEVFRR